MKFSEISYNRPDVEAAKKFYTEAAERLSTAGSFGEAEAVFLAVEDFSRQLDTMFTVAQIRHDIDTRDEFYNAEAGFIDSAAPELQEFTQRWDLAMLASPYRPEFERKYNRLMFLNTEIDLRTFSSEIVPELQRENALTTEYSKLLASAQIPFEGGTYTLSQLTPIKQDTDAARRRAAWAAEDAWYAANEQRLDGIYDELVTLRDAMGKKLGHDGYIPLGYDRMMRNCYGKDDVERFRAARARVHSAHSRERLRRCGKAPGEDAAHGLRRLRHVVPGRQRQAHRHAGGDTRRRAQFLPRAERGDGGVHRLHAG